MFSTLAGVLFCDCHFGLLPQTLDYFEFRGGDDGARTRDLCRDRAAERRNLLEQGATAGVFGALGTVGNTYCTLIEPTTSALTTSDCSLCRTHTFLLAAVSGDLLR